MALRGPSPEVSDALTTPAEYWAAVGNDVDVAGPEFGLVVTTHTMATNSTATTMVTVNFKRRLTTRPSSLGSVGSFELLKFDILTSIVVFKIIAMVPTAARAGGLPGAI